MPQQTHKRTRPKPIRTDRQRAFALVAIFAFFAAVYIVAIFTPGFLRTIEPNLVAALSLLVSVGVTVLVTTFSFVFVALSLVSVQFSPRVVRHFWHGDRFRSVFLWSSITIFFVCFVLLFIESTSFRLLAVLFGVYQIFVLFPVFLGYLADNLNAASLTKNIADRTISEIARAYEKSDIDHRSDGDRGVIRADESGFLQRIDTEKLAAVFSDVKAKHGVGELRSPNYLGSFIEVGSTLAVIEPALEITQHEHDEILDCFYLHKFRSYEQDVEYGIRQLVDIGVKAISPAVNDPTTCVNCIHYLGVIIKELATCDDSSREARSMRSRGIILKEPTFEQYVDDAFDQIYQFGRRDHVVVRAIIGVMTEVIDAVQTAERAEVIVKEVDDMELGAGDGGAEPLFALAEQRKYVLKSLARFYLAAAARFEYLGAADRATEMRRLSTSCSTK